MTKSELIKDLNKIPGDPQITLYIGGTQGIDRRVAEGPITHCLMHKADDSHLYIRLLSAVGYTIDGQRLL